MANQWINTTIPSSDSSITYLPKGSWQDALGPFAIGGLEMYDQGTSGFIDYTFTQPATGFEWWGYQRSDGGLYSVCFDCPAMYTGGTRVDGLNASTHGVEPPRLLYSIYNLTYAIHNVTIANLFDPRGTRGNSTTGAFGQMNIDRMILISPAVPPTSSIPASAVPTATSTDGVAAPTSNTSPSTGGNTSSHSHAGAIAGGVVGGLAALASLLVLFWFLFWRNRKAARPQDMTAGDALDEHKDGSFVQPNPVTPFILSPPEGPIQDTQAAPTMTATMSPISMPIPDVASPSGPSVSSGSSQYGPARPLPTRSQTGTTVNTVRPGKGARQMSADPVVRQSEPVTSPSIYPASSDYSGPTSLTQTVSPRREQDAGFLQGDDLEEEEPETLPPDYHAATANPRPPAQT